MWRTTILALALLLPSDVAAQDQRSFQLIPTGPYVYGKVVFPDGKPAPGARLLYTAEQCSFVGYGGEEVTDADGEFRLHFQSKPAPNSPLRVPAFPGCEELVLGASFEEDLWLPTLETVLRTERPGILQKIELLNGLPRHDEPLVVQLMIRGAQLDIHAWDSHTQQNVDAEIALSRLDCGSKPCGLIWARYEADGSPLSNLLPAGNYRIELKQFQCGSRRISVEPSSVTLDIVIVAGARRLVRLEFDSTQVRAAETFDNPEAKPCQPSLVEPLR